MKCWTGPTFAVFLESGNGFKCDCPRKDTTLFVSMLTCLSSVLEAEGTSDFSKAEVSDFIEKPASK